MPPPCAGETIKAGMKRLTVVIACAALGAGLGFAGFKLYQTLESIRGEMADLRRQVVDATETAQRESSAASAASLRADQAAIRAEIASGARQKAEEQKQRADLDREQAVSTAQQADERAKQAQEQMSQMRREREEELNRMQEALNRVVETHRTPSGMLIVLPDSTFRFDFDSAELSQKNRELLSRIAGILLISKGYGLSVFGYTDDIGTEQYNQQLSERRAKAVEDYLVHAGIDESIIRVKGYGTMSPHVTGTTASARGQNRRVEIALTDSSVRYGGDIR
jgi:outer membrane protein OmpA-like peptidoglycan-associated protein